MTIEIALRHRFGAFSLDAHFKIERSGITALFGPSGTGKTTIANAIAGLFRPSEGRIALNERVVFDSQEGIFVPARLRRIGYVFQDARLFPHMSVENNLRFGWRRATERAGPEEFERVVNLLGLESLIARKPHGLSGGEKSRVALGRALLARPRLLVLDEPLAALDTARRNEIMPWLERLRDDAALPMIYITHTLEEVARLADTLVLLKDGRVISQGSTFDLLPDLEFAAQIGIAPMGAIFAAAVSRHRETDGLTELAFDGGTLLVARLAQTVGQRLRVRLRAEDVMLARQAPGEISANNVLPATVSATRAADAAHADVQLACGGVKLVARITRASLARLDIKPKMDVFAIIKAVTVDSR